jgi:hypothetical protein
VAAAGSSRHFSAEGQRAQSGCGFRSHSACPLAKARINQLIEDGTYPGLEAAIEEASASGDAVEGHLESKAEAAEALLAAKQRPPGKSGEPT